MSKSLEKLQCPYHKVLPTYGELVYNEHSKDMNEHSKDMFWRCPICNKCNPTPGKHNKFGYGYWSQYSANEALRNWNNAVRRFMKRAIVSVLNGKDLLDDYNKSQQTPMLNYVIGGKSFSCAQ